MKARNILLSLLFSLASVAYSSEKSAPDQKMAEMMKAWQDSATPGPEHAMLKSLVGKWKVTTKSWQSEGAVPEETVGSSTFKSILGGRFVQQDFKGKMMGQSYEGTGMMGYNNVTKKFESTWHDSMSTASMRLEGTFDPTTKVIAETGEYHCPIRKSSQKMRSEFKIIDNNNATFTMYMPDMATGKEFKGMEQVYKRQ
ncbi:MAG: hypothetical protein A4S09_17010 [Proteobacteria bacterium SG_bin7]|nr:MAG: hypothetical protein A4S09_17010 [Proteobacteria bacterium SG_bin7]